MRSVNLIPTRRIIAQHRRTRLRWWAGAIGGYTVLLVAASVICQSVWGTGEQAMAHEQGEMEQRLEEARQQVKLLYPQLAEAQLQLEASRAVSVQPDWSTLLALLNKTRGDFIVLEVCYLRPAREETKIEPTPNRLQFLRSLPVGPESGAAAAEAKNGKKADKSRKPMRFTLEIGGLGRTQNDVTNFVRRLEEQKLFSRVAIMETRRDAFNGADAVAFRLECLIEEKSGGPS